PVGKEHQAGAPVFFVQGRQGSVASWLYGVAHRTARKARTAFAQRRTRQKQVMTMPNGEDPFAEVAGRERHAMLHEELHLLPRAYQEPIVLYTLEGKTYEESAHLLGCPLGTVKSRLARGRDRGRGRGARRGRAVWGGLGAGVLSPPPAAAVPVSLAAATVRAAMLTPAGPAAVAGIVSPRIVDLTAAVLQSLAATRLKIVLAVVLLGLGLAGMVDGVRCSHTPAVE